MVGEDTLIREGTSTNIWIVDGDGVLRTHPLSDRILGGITRDVLCALADGLGLRLEERAFDLEEALSAREAFISSSTNFVMPVIELDGQQIGDGKPGAVTLKLCAAYWNYVEQQTGVNHWS